MPLERLRELIPRATTNVLRLPNLGRESHTYLHHILENYDELPEVLLLLPGNSLTHPWRLNTTRELLRRLPRLHSGGVCCKRNDIADRDDGPLLDLAVDHWTCTDPQNLMVNTDGGMLPAPQRYASAPNLLCGS